jgi:rod shape determining protein RodA
MKSWFLPACIAVFAIISLVTIGSVRSDLLIKQAFFFVLGGVTFYATSRISFAKWLEWRWPLYVGLLLLLTLPMLFGHSSRNTSRWIEFGFLRLQPSQLAVPIVGLTSAWLLTHGTLTFRRIALFLLSLLPPAILIFISPDLGTTVVFLAILLSSLWFAGSSIRTLLAISVCGLAVVALSWLVILKPYQRERMLSFIAGSQQEQQQHYNAAQALIAVGGGQVTGKGWGLGTQSHLQFLPERQTDFIFSSFAEEFGFVGASLLLLVILLTALLLFYYARKRSDVAAGLYLMLAAITLLIQAGVNIGMNIGLLPITGVTLPLVSYGGSSILATCVLFGIAHSIVQSPDAQTAQIIT